MRALLPLSNLWKVTLMGTLIAYAKMDPIKKATWLIALRSGLYRQTTQVLTKDGRYCCLGVELKVLHNLTPMPGDMGFKEFVEGMESTWTEIIEKDGVDEKAITILVRMNDTGSSFTDIADWIEEHI